jgi:MIP family channel proteins
MNPGDVGRRFGAELVGTFCLVFAGCGAVVANSISNGALGHVGISLVFGLIIAAMIYACGHLSGAHFNPAVTLAFSLSRNFAGKLVPVYWIAQLAGAFLASGLLLLLYGNVAHLGATIPSGPAWQSLVVEIVLTFILMFVVMAVATDTRAAGQAAALAIGAAIGLDVLSGGLISGGSMNPARSLGPAIVSGGAPDQWVYIAGPFIGAAAGALFYQMLRGSPDLPAPAEVPIEVPADVPDADTIPADALGAEEPVRD